MACIVSPAKGAAILYLSTDQTGAGDSEHILDRGPVRISVLLRITQKTAGTCNFTPQGSMDVSLDPTSFYDVGWMVSSDPALAIKTGPAAISAVGSKFYILQPDWPWRFLKIAYGSNSATVDVRVSF